MKRIFVTLALCATTLLLITIVLGLNIDDAKSVEAQGSISQHMLIGMGALTFGILVHAISLTYFMGTGRWIEETSNAYGLGDELYNKSQKIKYGTLPGLTTSVGLLIATGAFGAVADPATQISLDGFLGMSGATIHFGVAITTLVVNGLTNFTQFVAISKNSLVVESVLAEVRRIRTERGLPT